MSLSATAPTLAKAVGVTFGTYCLSDFLSNFIQVRSFEPINTPSCVYMTSSNIIQSNDLLEETSTCNAIECI